MPTNRRDHVKRSAATAVATATAERQTTPHDRAASGEGSVASAATCVPDEALGAIKRGRSVEIDALPLDHQRPVIHLRMYRTDVLAEDADEEELHGAEKVDA